MKALTCVAFNLYKQLGMLKKKQIKKSDVPTYLLLKIFGVFGFY
jgi:hypothetical protein